MSPRSILTAALSASVLVVASCSSTLSTYQCQVDSDCQATPGGDGICEANDFCSFTDPECGEDGRRYSENSGALSNLCVSATSIDAGSIRGEDSGVADASGDASPDAGSLTLSFRQGVGGYIGAVDTTIEESGDQPLDTEPSISIQLGEDYGLLRFNDIFGADAGLIPSGATILEAILVIAVFDTTGAAAEVREVAVDWDNLTIYDTFGPVVGVQSTDMHPEIVTTLPETAGTHALDVTESLRQWASGARTNRGWIFVATAGDDHRFRSSEHSSVIPKRPLLVVEYVLP